MWLILVEALVALGILVFIVWWTMFSGRRNDPTDDPRDDPSDALQDRPRDDPRDPPG